MDGLVQRADFGHQGLIDRQTTSRVHQQHIKEMLAGIVQCGQGDVQRLLIGRAGEPFGPGLRSHGFELLDRRRAVHVGRDREDFFLALFNQVLGQFGRGGGFTRTLQAGHQNHRWGLCGQVDVGHALAHGGGQLLADDAHQGLTRLERTHDLLAQGFVFHTGDEVAHHRQRHVGFQQGHAHLAQHVGHVGFGDASLTTDLLDES